MTTITQPTQASFNHQGNTGFADAFVTAALAAGFGGHGFVDSFALLYPSVWDGLEGDRPAWVVYQDSSGLTIAPGWKDQGQGFTPFVYSFSEASIECHLNAITGSWWIAQDATLKAAGSRIRRFQTDLADGIFSRYLLLQPASTNGGLIAKGVCHYGAVYDPITHQSSATQITEELMLFSPLGNVGSFSSTPFSGTRLADTLAPTLAPVFPMFSRLSKLMPPIYMGELLDLMVATDGFDIAAQPMPNWQLLKSDAAARFYYAAPVAQV